MSSAVSSVYAPASSTSAVASLASASKAPSPVTPSSVTVPSAAQQSFMQAMASTSAVTPVSSVSSQSSSLGAQSGSITYTEQYLQAFVQSMTSQKAPATPLPGDTTYPAARNLLASWFSILTPQEQAIAGQQLQQLAPGLNSSVLASQGSSVAGSLPGSSPTQAALAQAALIPTESVSTALNDVIAAMGPSLYNEAGRLAMNYQMATNVIIDGMPLLSYVNQAAVEALQGDGADK